MVDHTRILDNEKGSMDDKEMSCKIRSIMGFITIIVLLIVIFASIGIATASSIENTETPKDVPLSDRVKMQDCKCVAFRLDDIQGYWLNDVQIAVMDVFDAKDVPLTIGMIGGDTFQVKSDSKIVEFVKKKIDKKFPLIRIANHGWEHEDFTKVDLSTQVNLINKTNQKISKIFGTYPKVFIPPYNKFNDNTIAALVKNNMTHFSSTVEMINAPFLPTESNIHHFPETSTTGKIDEDIGIFHKIKNKETINSIKTSIDEHGFAVIMMHPQEFSTVEKSTYINKVNVEHIEELDKLIDEVKEMNLKIVFLDEINSNYSDIMEEETPSQSQIKQIYAVTVISLLILVIMILIAYNAKKLKQNARDECMKASDHIWKFIPVKGYQYGQDYYQCVKCFEYL